MGETWVQKQRPRVTHLAVILAGLTLALFAASPAEAARTEFFGIAQGRELDGQDLDGMKASRVQTDRFMIPWYAVQPSQRTIDWSGMDRIVGGLASHGIRPVPFVWGSPSWVRPGPSRPPVGTTFAETAWQNFLKAAVARYGSTGSYWANGYRQRYGASATPLPIQSWQIWNEPNLQKYFDPGGTSAEGISKYARLVKISHDAIKSKDSHARIVLGGLLGSGRPLAWDFLSGLYKVSGFKNNFDVAALHPYTTSLDGFRRQILRFRAPMTNHGDGAKPLWLTEFAWGSAPPDQFGINKGLAGQAQMLSGSFKMILSNRKAWNVQRIFWFLWRDPSPSQGTGGCSFCASAGLLRYDRSAKPAYSVFRSFTVTPPQASITAGPSQGGFTKDSTPSFSFASSKVGSTFVCRVDGSAYKPCSSPYTTPLLSDATHLFYVKAIDANGNESQVVWRSFTVDTRAPETTITGGPSGSTADHTPTFTFTSSESGSTFQCRFDSQPFGACSGPGASHTPSTSLSDGAHSFDVRAIDKANNADPTPARRTFTVVP
jgi:Glycosyl hydrolase catalytic core